MIVLNYLGALNLLSYLTAYYCSSVPLLFVATLLQASVAALNEPCRAAVIPLLVTNDAADLKKATTLGELAWSVMSAVGSALGGFILPVVGIPTCFGELLYHIHSHFCYHLCQTSTAQYLLS